MRFLSRKLQSQPELHNNCDCRPIVFIDSRIYNHDIIVQQLIAEVRAIVIGSQCNGVRDISDILKSSCCQEIHLMCHGSPGCLYLGNSELSLSTLTQYNLELQSWFVNALPDCDADFPRLSIYGCNVAMGDVGEEFITKLSSLTKAKIAATASLNHTNLFR